MILANGIDDSSVVVPRLGIIFGEAFPLTLTHVSTTASEKTKYIVRQDDLTSKFSPPQPRRAFLSCGISPLMAVEPVQNIR